MDATEVVARRMFDGRDFSVEYLGKGAFGWAEEWRRAADFAVDASVRYQKRHRVYWSEQGRAWMIRRAHGFAD